MGCCTSSTEYVVDPVTGQEKKKKKLGGAYPGQRRPTHQPHVPTEFDNNGQGQANFVTYGGGNALTLAQNDGSTAPEVGKPQAQFIEVTVPPGVYAGQVIHVQTPSGETNEVVVPSGFKTGDKFTVEFAAPKPSKFDAPEPSKFDAPSKPQEVAPTATATIAPPPGGGFAHVLDGPTGPTATPVYSTTPVYPK